MAYESFSDTIRFNDHAITIRATCVPENWPVIRRDIISAAKAATAQWEIDDRERGRAPYTGAYTFDAAFTTLAESPNHEHSVAVEVTDADGTDKDGGYIHIRGWEDPESSGFPNICRSCGREALDHDSKDRLYCIMCGEPHRA